MAGVSANAEDRAIVHAIGTLARDLSMDTVAEGIETPIELQHARDAGFTSVQGYLFSRPVTAERIAELIAAGPLAGTERPEPMQPARRLA